MNVINVSYAVGRPYGSIMHSDGFGDGGYVCNDGIVTIHYDVEYKRVLLSTVKNSRLYYRTILGNSYTDIGLARIAGKFIRELTNIV